MKKILLSVLLVFLTGATHLFAQENFKGKTVRIIAGFPAGGGIDISARLLVDPFKEALNLPVIVENRVGAAGMIAANAVAKAPPDGRRFALENLAEEEGIMAGPGEDRKPHDHMELIFRFCKFAGLSEKEVKTTRQLPAWRARSYFYINTAREEPFGVIVAMQSTQEGQQPALNGERMLPGFKKHFGLEIEDPRIEFFAEHYIADADHSSRQIDLVAKHVTTEEMQKRALEVAETMVRTRWAGITECYRAYVLGEKDPLPKGIAA